MATKLIVIDSSVIIFQIVHRIEERFWMEPIEALTETLSRLIQVEMGLKTFCYALLQQATLNLSRQQSALQELMDGWPIAEWEAESRIYAESAIGYVNNLGWAPNLLDHPCKVIWAEDSKPYWRNDYTEGYKAGRPEKSDCFGAVLATLRESGVTRLAFPRHEADDIAGAIVKLWASSTRQKIDQIFLVTIDSDWLGLLDDPDVFWCCTGNFAPRIRQRQEVFTHLQSKWNKQAKKWKAAWAIPHEFTFRPSQIWEWKSVVGDKADNLPPGTDISLIDLLNPPEAHDLSVTGKREICDAITSAPIIEPRAWREHEQTIFMLGVSRPFEPLLIEKPMLWATSRGIAA